MLVLLADGRNRQRNAATRKNASMGHHTIF